MEIKGVLYLLKMLRIFFTSTTSHFIFTEPPLPTVVLRRSVLCDVMSADKDKLLGTIVKWVISVVIPLSSSLATMHQPSDSELQSLLGAAGYKNRGTAAKDIGALLGHYRGLRWDKKTTLWGGGNVLTGNDASFSSDIRKSGFINLTKIRMLWFHGIRLRVK